MKILKIIFLLAISLSFFWTSLGIPGHQYSHYAFADDDADADDDNDNDGSYAIELEAPFPGMETDPEGEKGRLIITKDDNAVTIMGKYVSAVYKFGVAVVSIFAVIMLMIGGYEFMMAGGDSGKTDNARTRIEQALFGLVLVFLSALLLNFINPTFFKII